LRDCVRSKPSRLSGTQGFDIDGRRGRFFAGRGAPLASLVGSEVAGRFGEGAELRGESVAVSDNVVVLHPSLPERAAWEEVAAVESESGGGCPELAGALWIAFTGRRTQRLT
jgi:hypothetical protein